VYVFHMDCPPRGVFRDLLTWACTNLKRYV
jgi:hypothetical protein